MSGAREAFSKIYSTGEWHPTVKSGIGSDPSRTGRYREILEATIKRLPIKSVVDMGCGDWSFSRSVDWNGLEYTGFDVVPDLIEHHNREFAKPGVSFKCGDAIAGEVPTADLLVSKDVMQHWPNAAVSKFLRESLPRFKYALLTNDVHHYRKGGLLRAYRPKQIGVPNEDIPMGSWRPLRLRDAPFNLKADVVEVIEMTADDLVWHKEILLCTST
jgi:hypothetical protein